MRTLLLVFLSLFSLSLWAQEEKKVEAKAETKTSTDAVDETITNRKLRAETGSLSRWSMSSSLNYNAGSVASPLDPERPNITAGKDVLLLQNISGTVGVRYRLSTFDNITLQTGFFMTTPFHDRIKTSDTKRREAFESTNRKLNVNDPAIRYVHIGKVWGAQSVTSASGTLITNNQLKNAGYASYFDADQTFMYEVPETKLSLGATFYAGAYTLSKDDPNLATYNVAFYPSAEYVINDTYNLRTVFGQWVYQQLKGSNTNAWEKLKVYQSVGLGISVTRDIFLYPNIQFIPSDVRSDRTNIAMSASINVF
jgi:hypothetical protein